MLYSPIATRIRFGGGGVRAQISSPAVGVSADYDPTSETDFAPSGPSITPVVGVYESLSQEGLAETFTARFQFVADERPPGLLPNVSMLIMSDRDLPLQINKIDLRYWRGRLDGFDLMLSA